MERRFCLASHNYIAGFCLHGLYSVFSKEAIVRLSVEWRASSVLGVNCLLYFGTSILQCSLASLWIYLRAVSFFLGF